VGADVAAMVPPLRELPRGGIIGRALVVAHVEPTGATRTHPTEPDAAGPYADRFPLGIDFRWHMDESYALVLVDAEPLPFLPCSGGLTLWTPPCAFNRNTPDLHKEVATHHFNGEMLCHRHAATLDRFSGQQPMKKSEPLVPERWALPPAGL